MATSMTNFSVRLFAFNAFLNISHFLVSKLEEYLLQASGNSSQTSNYSKMSFETKILMLSPVLAYQE